MSKVLTSERTFDSLNYSLENNIILSKGTDLQNLFKSCRVSLDPLRYWLVLSLFTIAAVGFGEAFPVRFLQAAVTRRNQDYEEFKRLYSSCIRQQREESVKGWGSEGEILKEQK